MGSDDEQERLVRALRAAGSSAELSEEERYRAMFRTTHSAADVARTRRSRASSRFLAGGAVAVVLAIGTGGVAAAYSGHLPSPIQTLAHHVIGAPEASPRTPASVVREARARASATPSGPVSDAPRPASVHPAPHPHRQSHRPEPSAHASTSSATSGSATAPTSPTPAPSAPPTTTPAVRLTGVTVVGAPRRADVGARVPFSGRLTFSGTPTSPRRVVLQQQVGSRWTPVAHDRSDADGSITLTAPGLQRTSRFRLVAGQGAHTVSSAPRRVAMHPAVTADASATKEQVTVDVTAAGGFRGDALSLLTRRNGHLVVVDRGRLDSSGRASFVVAPEQRRRSYVVVLGATEQHTSARIKVVVGPARRTAGD